jgi:hypothetical protein
VKSTEYDGGQELQAQPKIERASGCVC